MAITKLTYPAAGTPLENADYTRQNALTYAAIVQGLDGWKLSGWNDYALPVLKQGTYIRHQNCAYVVDTADYTILGSALRAYDNYVVLSGVGDTITATWTQSRTGFAYNPVLCGVYNAAGDQLLVDYMHYEWSGDYINKATAYNGKRVKSELDGLSIITRTGLSKLTEQAISGYISVCGISETEVAAASPGKLSMLKWNGSTWAEIGYISDSAIPNTATVLTLSSNRVLLDAGNPHVYTAQPNRWIIYDWNGSTFVKTQTTNSLSWSGYYSAGIRSQSRLDDNTIVLLGWTLSPDKYFIYVMRLSGTTWTKIYDGTFKDPSGKAPIYICGVSSSLFVLSWNGGSSGSYYWENDVYSFNGSSASLIYNTTNNHFRNVYRLEDNVVISLNRADVVPTPTYGLTLFTWTGSAWSSSVTSTLPAGDSCAVLTPYAFVMPNTDKTQLQTIIFSKSYA